jgi:hypothetical protein
LSIGEGGKLKNLELQFFEEITPSTGLGID